MPVVEGGGSVRGAPGSSPAPGVITGRTSIQVFYNEKACDNATLDQLELNLGGMPGSRLKRITIADATTAPTNMTISINDGRGQAIEVVHRGVAAANEQLSWEGDLPASGVGIWGYWEGATLADTLIIKALVEHPT